MLVQLRSRIPNIARRAGKFVTEADVLIKLEGDADVYKPNGEPLVALRRGAIPLEMCERALPSLRVLKDYKSTNRASYAGGKARKRIRKDGSVSRVTEAVDENGEALNVSSAVVGYFDRQGGRFPYCRETVFVGKEPEHWKTIMPMVEQVADVMKVAFPERYAKQMSVAAKTHSAYLIGKTPFTTITVNNTVVGAIHTDKGDYKEGIGAISVVRRGQYEGGWLVFPEYGVAADLQDGDVLFFNSHDWHGVTHFKNTQEGFERISIVYYYRSKMFECGSPQEEMERARARYGSLE